MIWQHFLMLQLGLLALGLGGALGFRSWQLRRLMAALTESYGQPPVTDTDATSTDAAAEGTTEQAAEGDGNKELPPKDEAEDKTEAPETTDVSAEPAIEPDSDAQEDNTTAADDSTDDFDDLDELLETPSDVEAEIETEAETPSEPEPEREPEPNEESIAENRDSAEAEPLGDTAPPAAKPDDSEEAESGLRALVTKFAAENRELMERVQALETEIQSLAAAATPAEDPPLLQEESEGVAETASESDATAEQTTEEEAEVTG